MRSRERLIEVLMSCNRWITGGHMLFCVGALLKDGTRKTLARETCRAVLRISDSTHYQELAREALHYLGETTRK